MADLSRSWIDAYNKALEEVDVEKLQQRVLEAEIAIFSRWQELSVLSDCHKESVALGRACAQLLKIKMERLRWPGLDFLVKTEPYHRN
jgi:hypothetical protein